MKVYHLSPSDVTRLMEAASYADGDGRRFRVAIDSDGFKYDAGGGWTPGVGIIDPYMLVQVTCGECSLPVVVSHSAWHYADKIRCQNPLCDGFADLRFARSHGDDPCND